MSVPKSARVDIPSSVAAPPGDAGRDTMLVDTWELMYQIDANGSQVRPEEGSRILIELTSDGRVIFKKVDKDQPENVKSRFGTYSPAHNEISITDDKGNSVKWAYEITGNTLTITWPKMNYKFVLRRAR
jgi:YD repeat-containing protein